MRKITLQLLSSLILLCVCIDHVNAEEPLYRKPTSPHVEYGSIASVKPKQIDAPIQNFVYDENDTLRYTNHYLFEKAYYVIKNMLEDRHPIDFAEASFAVENCFYDGAISYAAYQSELHRIANGVTNMASSPMIQAPTRDVALNYAIYLFYTHPCDLNHYHPYQYGIELLIEDRVLEGGMVHHLLTTGYGTCHSLPYLYKIIADKVGARAYLAMAPMHTYIRHQDAWGQWWNFETTVGTYSRSSFIMDNFHISEEAIRSGLYMTNLTDKESVVLLLCDLLYIYQYKTGFYSNSFIRQCYTLGLRYHHASNLHTWQINDLKYQLDKEAWNRGFRTEDAIRKDSVLKKKYDHIQFLRTEFESLGYHEFTTEEYLQKYQEAIDYMSRHNIPLPNKQK